MTTTSEAIAMWESARKITIAELENVPDEQWEFRPAEGARTLREIARHILESSVGFVGELLDDQPTFARIFAPETRAKFAKDYPEQSAKSETIAQFRAAFEDDMKRLHEAGDLAAQTMTLMKQPQSRLTGLWFAIGHEMYHRGQLATYARALGHVPAMTQQSQARQR